MIIQNYKNKFTKLEKRFTKQNFVVRFLALSWILMFGLILLFAANWRVDAVDDKLKTRQLAIVDENGTPRIVLGAPKPDPQVNGKIYKRRSPSHGIQFNDEKGDEIGGIGRLEDGTMNLCFDARSKDGDIHESTCMLYFPDGRTGFLVKDENGNQRVGFGITSVEGHTGLVLSDAKGRARIRLTVEPDGTPKIEMFDEKGKPYKNDRARKN